MNDKSRLAWGILGTGRIAAQFAAGLNASERCALVAVGSRQAASAAQFAATHHVATAHASYEALLADPAVKAVYVSLPNSMHYEWTIKALRAGKHVLCEKPMAIAVAHVEEMFDVAAREGKVLAEGFMYRSHPQTLAIQEAVAGGKIGKLKLIRTCFCFAAAKVQGSIKFNTDLAGGSLMDVGCYCLSYSRLFAGAEPVSLTAVAQLHTSGVDEYAVGTLVFPGGVLANFASGMTIQADNTAFLIGTEGYLEIPMPWKPPEVDAAFTLVDGAGKRTTTTVSAGKHLYAPEADDFAAAVLDGKPTRVSRADSVGNQRCLDVLRKQMGLPY